MPKTPRKKAAGPKTDSPVSVAPANRRRGPGAKRSKSARAPQSLAQVVSHALEDLKALETTFLDVRHLTTVTDSASVLQTLSLANGTGSSQVNGYWRDVRTVGISATDTINTTSLPLSVFGTSGTLNLGAADRLADTAHAEALALGLDVEMGLLVSLNRGLGGGERLVLGSELGSCLGFGDREVCDEFLEGEGIHGCDDGD